MNMAGTATVSSQQVKQFYDCHMQGNCDIRNLFFKKTVYKYSV